MKKDMYKAICKQINYKVVGKQPQRAGDVIKCLKKEMSLFEDEGVRGKYLQQVYDLLLTIRRTSVESERAFSAAGIILNKLSCRMDNKTLDPLCFLRGYFYGIKDKSSTKSTNKLAFFSNFRDS